MKSIILYTPLKFSLFSDVSENEESFFVGESSEKLKYDGQSYIPAVAQFYWNMVCMEYVWIKILLTVWVYIWKWNENWLKEVNMIWILTFDVKNVVK